MERARRQEIEQLLRDYADRGDRTRQQFCESRGMSLSALDYYLRHYGKVNGKEKPKQDQPRLATVRLAAPELATTVDQGVFRLVLRNGRTIECGRAQLEQLIRVAESL
jgi:hypothetical protein